MLTFDHSRYSIEDPNCPVTVDPVQGHLSLKKQLDREEQSSYTFQVTAHEDIPNGKIYYYQLNYLHYQSNV